MAIIKGTNKDDFLMGKTGSDILYGYEGNDTLFADSGNDTLYGGNGNDMLYGMNGNDTLYGGDGKDEFLGGQGKDLLTGGKGADKFSFDDLTESGVTTDTRDVISDFNRSQGDKISFQYADADLTKNDFQHFSFIGSKAFSAPAQLRFDPVTHILYANDDADKSADFSLQLTGVKSLQASDFILL